MKSADYIGLGFCSNDHLAVLPFIPMDTKVKMVSHAIMGGGPAANSTAGAAALGMSAAFVGTVGDDADGRMILDDFARQGVDTSMVKVRKGATSAIAYLWIEEKTGARSCAWTREGRDELRADEIDPEAVAVATENAEKNGVKADFDPFALGRGRALPGGLARYDVVAANILGPLLVRFADEIAPCVGGRLIVSGILNELYPEVLAAYEARGFRELDRTTLGEWTTGLLSKL